MKLASLSSAIFRKEFRLILSRQMNGSTQNRGLSPEIEELHRLACEKGERTYIDPATGYTVFTEIVHKKRGTCCGNKCRHCPFDHVNVPASKR